MSEILHRVVIITGTEDGDDVSVVPVFVEVMDSLLSSFSAPMRELMKGPFKLRNGFIQYVLLSTGSGRGWPASIEHEWCCAQLLAEFDTQAVMVSYGDTEPKVLQNSHTRPKPIFEEDANNE